MKQSEAAMIDPRIAFALAGRADTDGLLVVAPPRRAQPFRFALDTVAGDSDADLRRRQTRMDRLAALVS